MRNKKRSIGFAAPLAIFAVTVLMTSTRAAAQTEEVLYRFHYTAANNKGGFFPNASLIFDADGNLYGTTPYGDTNDLKGGTVFELTKMCGRWTEKTLHDFGNGRDGYNPFGCLIFDASGNLYGTTLNGGSGSCRAIAGCGTVFELSPTADGGWKEKLLHSFNHNLKDGINPVAGLTFDAAGNLYGTTQAGGAYGWGTVFELSPTADGGWTSKVLLRFVGKNGYNPVSRLIFDAAGNLYGTTRIGGEGASFCGPVLCGVVFELTPTASGTWNGKVLHYFGTNEDDGTTPDAGLIFDASGNLYGTTSGGGRGSAGTVFELSPAGSGIWTEKILHNFAAGLDGEGPGASLIFDASGNLYGTTINGGGPACSYPSSQGCGTVFEVKP